MSDPRRASDDYFIRLLREGLHDSEVGVRLGITTGEVRARKADLRGKLGDEQYYRLLDPSRPVRRSRKWRKPVAIVGAIVGAVALLLVVANLVVGEEEAIAPARTSASPTPRPTPRVAAVVTVDGQAYLDAGVFVTVGTAGAATIGGVENRPALTVVRLNETAFLSASEFVQWARVGGGRGQLRLGGTLNGRQVQLQVNSADSATRIRSLTASVGPVAEVGSQFSTPQASFFVRAFAPDGQQLPARVEDDGRLLIAAGTFPAEWIIDRATGRRMATSDAVVVGRLAATAGVSATNTCTSGPNGVTCKVTWLRSLGMVTAASGTMTCAPDGLELVTGSSRLIFSLRSPRSDTLRCEALQFPERSLIVPAGDWEVSAASTGGTALSVGVTAGGEFVVGRFEGDLACPCLSE